MKNWAFLIIADFFFAFTVLPSGQTASGAAARCLPR